MRVIGKREGLTSQGGRASRQREGPKPGPRSQQEHGVFWNSEPGIKGTSQTTTDYTKGSAFIKGDGDLLIHPLCPLYS